MMQTSAHDTELWLLLREEVLRDGGCAKVNALKDYNPRIGRLLGDRRLVRLLQEHGGFVMSADEKTVQLTEIPPNKLDSPITEGLGKPDSRSSSARHDAPTYRCSICGADFPSRNRLFKHLKQTAKNAGVCVSNINLGGSRSRSLNANNESNASRKNLLIKLKQQCVYALRGREIRIQRRSNASDMAVPPASLWWLCTNKVVCDTVIEPRMRNTWI